MAIVEEEADECVYWLELFIDSGQVNESLLSALLKEANELTALSSASRKQLVARPFRSKPARLAADAIDNRQ